MKFYFFSLVILLTGCNTPNDDASSKTGTENSAPFEGKSEVDAKRLAKPALVKATVEINQMKSFIEMADSGKVDKSELINRYNANLGRIMGTVKTFEALRQKIDSTGSAYIEVMHEKEAARIEQEKNK